MDADEEVNQTRPSEENGSDARLSASSPPVQLSGQPTPAIASSGTAAQGASQGEPSTANMDTSDPPPAAPVAAGPSQQPNSPSHNAARAPLAPMTYEQLVQLGYQQRAGVMFVPVFMPPNGGPQPASLAIAPAFPGPLPQHCVGHAYGSVVSSSLPESEAALQRLSIQSERAEVSPRKKVRKDEESPSKEGSGGMRDLPMGIIDWDSITEPVMHMMFERLRLKDQQSCRLVSKRWCQMIDSNVKVMQPAKPNMQVLEQRFGRVESLDFRRCEQLRNRNLTALANSKKLEVQSICIGYLLAGAHVKPRITNKGLVQIASMISLRSVRLADCSAMTNSGITMLSRLTNLEHLSFLRCIRISEKGMNFLTQLPKLDSLTIFTCSKVTDGLFGVLRAVTHLKALHISHVRVSRECLDSFGEGALSLRELTINGVEVTPGSLISLATYTGLHALGLTNLYQIDSLQTMSMLGQLTELRRLNLLSVEGVRDSHLLQFSLDLVHLEHLKVIVDCRPLWGGMDQVTAAGIENLANLQSLQACTFESSNATALALNAVSCLTQLTSVEFPGTDMPSELLNALPYLPHLQSLGLQNLEHQRRVKPNRTQSMASLEPLLRCHALRRLDLSNTDVVASLATELLTRLHARDVSKGMHQAQLEELCVRGCVIGAAHLSTIGTNFPWINCHTHQRECLESSTWVWE